MKLRVLESQWTPFVQSLCARRDVESAGVLLAERLHGGDVLLARDMIVMSEQGYLIRRADQIRLDPVALNCIIRPARDNGLSVITVHTHTGTSHPWFSAADDHGDARLMPSLFHQMQGPHGSMVLAGETRVPAGRVWTETKAKCQLETRVVGKTVEIPGLAGIDGDDRPWFERQRLALGEIGQEILRRLHVVIVGLGGTGSVCFVQLAHLGVGRITVIDGDRVEDSNISRILGATTEDVGRIFKVEIAARYAQRLGLRTEVNCLPAHFGVEISPGDIAASDIALSCVDRHLPRALLNRFSYEKAVPLIDMGSAFRVGDSGRLTAGAGRVVIVGPGRPCLACWGHIDANRMRIEALPPAEREREVAEGYIERADVSQPSVMSFNTAIAGTAVSELLRLVTHFAGTDDPPLRLSFDFETGVVRRNRLPEGVGCAICLPQARRRDTLSIEARQ